MGFLGITILTFFEDSAVLTKFYVTYRLLLGRLVCNLYIKEARW